MEAKNILVTGAAGFIGFHTIQALYQNGANVIGYDNFNDYYDPELKRARARELEKIGVEVIRGDLCDNEGLERCLSNLKSRPTHVVHLAAQAGVRYSLENPQAYVDSNLKGFVNVLELCRRYKTKLIYASSSSVYGLNKKVPFSEEDRTDHPASLYGATKKANEEMAHAYHHIYGLCVTGLRFFTVYGPWGRPDMAYYKFTQKILNGEPIQVYNEGNMRRDFTHISDIVRGVLAAIDLGAPCEIFNLGNHCPVKLGEFIEIIERSVGKKAVKEMLPMQPGDVVETYADIDHSRECLGFEPRVSLEEGIFEFVEWYRDYARIINRQKSAGVLRQLPL